MSTTLEKEMAHASQAENCPETVEPLTLSAIEIDDGLDGDVCLTFAATRPDEPERCAYLNRSEIDFLLDWIQRFRAASSSDSESKR